MNLNTDPTSSETIVNTEIEKQASKSSSKNLMGEKMQKVPKVYKIGVAVFNSQIKRREYLTFFNGKICEELEKDIWKLRGPDENKKSNWPHVFRLMKQASIKEFHFQKNPQILKEIQAIDFGQLKQMNLFAANIQNYESFAFLNCPNLQKINLIYNRCQNFKALNKVNMPSLKIICIYIKQQGLFGIQNEPTWNQSFYIENFERWGFEFNELRLEKSKYDKIMLQDLSKLAKAKGSLKDVYICPASRIKNSKVLRTLGNGKAIKYLAFNMELNDFQELNIRDGESRIDLNIFR